MNQASPPAATDPALTPAQGAALRTLVNLLVPPSADGRMPGAADLPQLMQHVTRFAAAVPAMRDALDLLGADEAAGATLADLSARAPEAVRQLALETVTCYYQQDAVLERLGLEARPPFPRGYEVLSGDLMLLNPVRARGRIWRDAGDA